MADGDNIEVSIGPNGDIGNKDGDSGAGLGDIFGDGSPIATPSFGEGKNDNGNNGQSGSEPPKRGRGRPKGSTSKAKRTTDAIDLNGLEKLLISIHVGLAAITKSPEWEIDEGEAKSLAAASARCARHYPILDKVGDKAIDHLNLISVLGGVYGTRIFAYSLRKSSNRAKPTAAVVITPDFGQHGPAE